MKKVSFTLYFFFCTLFLFGQSTTVDDLTAPTSHVNKIVNTDPPNDPVRTMAEWEEIQTLLISWDDEPVLQTEIIRHAVNECDVLVIVKTEAKELAVKAILQTANIPLDNVFFLVKNFNRLWIRDYGPWSIYANEVEELALTDWIYDRPDRPLDDVVSTAIADELDLPFYEAIDNPYNWIHAGGNVLRDGMGTGFSSDLVYLANPTKTQKNLNNITAAFLGFGTYHVLPRLRYDVIHHLDMHMRLLDEETIIIGQYPEGVADGPQIEKNVDFIKNNCRTPFGNPYTIIRIDMPADVYNHYPNSNTGTPNGPDFRTYTNAIFINKTILVPIYNTASDDEALAIYQEHLPGYNVVGIDCNSIIPRVGAIHCITKLVGVKSPLWIAHPKLRNTFNTSTDYLVEAIIKHEEGINEAFLFYRKTGEATYTSISMEYNILTSKWQAAIPSQFGGTIIEYYIEAKANNGKIQRRPIVAPEGFFRFEVMAAQAKPKADFLKKEDNICARTIVQYENNSSDDVISWNWSFPGGTPAVSLDKNPEIIYNTAGIFDAQLIVENLMGKDTFLWKNAITAVSTSFAVQPFEEDFSTGENAIWKIHNPGDDTHFWQIVEDLNCHDAALIMNNWSIDALYTRDYVSKQFDLRDFTDVKLTFDIAYAYREGRIDELRVNIIRCNGQKNVIYNNNDTLLATVPATNNLFVPASCDEWRVEEIDLSDYDGEIIEIEFEAISNGGNQLYLDNIAVKGTPVPNILPSSGIYSPDNLTTLTTIIPPTLQIKAHASDTDGFITAVTFLVNGDSIAVDSTPPYGVEYEFPDFGEYKLRVRATDNENASRYSSPIRLFINAKNIPFEEAIKVFPVPAQKQLSFNLFATEAKDIHYDIYNTYAYGQRILSGDWEIQKGDNTEILNLQRLPSGTYFVNFSGEGWNVLKRFVVVD